MKKHTRNLLIIIPFLPLLMANSPAVSREPYNGLEVTYLSEETLHNYNFYHFNVKNVGEGYVSYFDIDNKQGEQSFYGSIENNEICPPFENVLIEPGFDKELVVATKNKIPESKEVVAECYDFYVPAEGFTFHGTMKVTYSLGESHYEYNQYVYKIAAYYDGTFSGNYYYSAAIKLTYNGITCCVLAEDLERFYFRTNEELDLEKLTVDDITMLQGNERYTDYYFRGNGCKNFLNSLLLFMLIFFLLLGFGIFSAIFFPAMARRRRAKALLEQDKK